MADRCDDREGVAKGLATEQPNSAHDEYFDDIANAIIRGQVIPFFGAGVNLCGRAQDWKISSGDLPGGAELAQHLAARFKYPWDDKQNLRHVSEYAVIQKGSAPLYGELHGLFSAAYTPTPLHRFFGELPRILREKCSSPRHQFIVTTNYDDAMEEAFAKENEPFDLAVYEAEHEQRGKFWHKPHDGEAKLIGKPNNYSRFKLDERSVIMKIHGAVDRDGLRRDSFVITEEHYLDYLTRTDVSKLVPLQLKERLFESSLLFLGYSLSDWNLRVILHRILTERRLSSKWWAIQLNPDPFDKVFWGKRDLHIIETSMENCIAELRKRI